MPGHSCDNVARRSCAQHNSIYKRAEARFLPPLGATVGTGQPIDNPSINLTANVSGGGATTGRLPTSLSGGACRTVSKRVAARLSTVGLSGISVSTCSQARQASGRTLSKKPSPVRLGLGLTLVSPQRGRRLPPPSPNPLPVLSPQCQPRQPEVAAVRAEAGVKPVPSPLATPVTPGLAEGAQLRPAGWRRRSHPHRRQQSLHLEGKASGSQAIALLSSPLRHCWPQGIRRLSTGPTCATHAYKKANNTL
jgi:hypothetical protein